MLRKGITICFVLFIIMSSVIAAPGNHKVPVTDNAVMDGTETFPDMGLGPAYVPPNTDDPLGEIFDMGDTWNDYQHNTYCGRMIDIDDMGWVHVIWMNSLDMGGSQRYIYYNLLDDQDNIIFTDGVRVDNSQAAGYTVLEVMSDNRGIGAFHQRIVSTDWYHSALSYDFFPHIGAFSTEDAPWVFFGIEDLKIEWPHTEVDRNDVIHMISTWNPVGSSWADSMGSVRANWYVRGELNATTDQWTFSDQFGNPQQEYMHGDATLISTMVAASPVSDKVAIAWANFGATRPDTTQHNNDVVIVVSDDGVSFDWRDTLNITSWIPPDLSLLPDTLRAERDTLRCYPDINMIYDYNDVLHIFFTTEWYESLYDTASAYINNRDAFIWHWDEVNQVFSLVASGWLENDYYEAPVWARYVCRPSPSIDPVTGELYCAYQRYFNPIRPSTIYPFPYVYGDTTDVSEAGFPNSEVWISRSTDGGYTWSEGTNVTNTQTPNGTTGNCLSEVYPSMADNIVNDQCHLFYILDKDAGPYSYSSPQGAGTLNDVIYQRIPTSLIDIEPILPVYPMHCDSTGMPDTVNVRPGGITSPNDFSLAQNYPNPFNPVTTIHYSLNNDGQASLKVYNIRGEEVATLFDKFQKAGKNLSIDYDASDLSSGIYFYQLEANGFSLTRKMVLMK